MKNNYLRVFVPVLIGILLYFTPAAAQSAKCGDDDYDCKVVANGKLILANPRDAEAYFNRALAYRHKEQWALAIRDLDKYLSLPNSNKSYQADGYRERGWARHKAADDRGALADLDRAIVINPDENEAYYSRGIIYRDQKDYRHAIADFSAYIGLNAAKPTYLADGYYQRGYVYNANGEYDKALKDLNIAIATDDTKGFYYTERAYAYRKLGKNALAESDDAKAAELKKR